MPVTSFSFSPTAESTISLQNMEGILAHRFTAVSSGRRRPYSVTCKLVRGGSTLTQWVGGFPTDTTIKKTVASSWDITGDVNHVLHPSPTEALEFTGATAGTLAEYERTINIPSGSRIVLSFDVDETIVGGDVSIEANLYNDSDVVIGQSVFKRSVGDGTGNFKLSFPISDPLTTPKLKFENVIWGASSGGVFIQSIVIEHYEPDTLQETNFQVFLYDIEANEIIATTSTHLDVSTLNLGINQFEFMLDDLRFRIENGKDYYLLFTLKDTDFTGWDTIPTNGEEAIPTGVIQDNLWIDIGEHTGLTIETDTDFITEPTNSPERSTKTISTLSGIDTTVLGLSGHYGLDKSKNHTLNIRILPSSLASYPGGGGANVLDLTVRVVDQTSTLVTSTVQIALEDAGTYQDFELDFSTSATESDVQIEVDWDATALNPTFTPDITMKITGVFVWEDDGIVTTPPKYQFPSYMVGYAGVFIVTEDATTETMSKRVSGDWIVDAALSGVSLEVKAADEVTTQLLLTDAGDFFFNLDTIWPPERVHQSAAMRNALGFIEQGLSLVGTDIPIPVQLRQNDTPYQSDWVVGLINDYGIDTIQDNGVYIWTTESNEYAGRFFYHNGSIIPFSVPLGNGRVELEMFSASGGTILSGTTTKYGLGSVNFTLLKPAKVKFIWAVSAVDLVTLADRLVNIRIELDGVPVPDGTASQDTTDKFFMSGIVSDPSNQYFLEFTFNDILTAGAHTISFKGTQGIGAPQMDFLPRLHVIPHLLNNFQIKDTSMLEITYL